MGQDSQIQALQNISKQNTAASMAEAKRNRTFTSKEAVKMRKFNRIEAKKNRTWQGNQAYKNRVWQGKQAYKNRVWSSNEAQKNRTFQERMSNTAYQRKMNDLKKAGLNPMLAYLGNGGGGSAGASTPTGSTAPSGGSAPSGSTPTGSTASQSSLPSGSQGQVDSAVNAVASVFNSFTQAATAKEVAGIHAAASRYASDQALQGSLAIAGATRYAADKQQNTGKRGQNFNLIGDAIRSIGGLGAAGLGGFLAGRGKKAATSAVATAAQNPVSTISLLSKFGWGAITPLALGGSAASLKYLDKLIEENNNRRGYTNNVPQPW